jgi:ectoine hydroxylase-related dioxygenase (phytanoyl-CoA dioxygenase family)
MNMGALMRLLNAEQHAQWQRDGFYVARGLFSADEVDQLRDHFMDIHANGGVKDFYEPLPLEKTNGDILKHYPRIMHPHRFDDLSKQYMLDSRLEDVLHDLFEEDALAAQSMLYFKPPGARGQALHQDNFYLQVSPGTCMAAWVPLDDADEENGGLFIAPGTHVGAIQCPHVADLTKSFTTEEVDVPQGIEPAPVELKRGDVLFFNGSVIHGSYPNISKERFRRAFICHYVGVSTTEMSEHYYPLHTFDGEQLTRDKSAGGGPCGTEEWKALQEANGKEVVFA